MRLLITNVLAMALLLFGVASANAFSTSMSSNYGGSDLGNGDTVTVTVDFDSGGVADIQVLSVSVLFNDAVVTYDAGASQSPTYALYNAGGRGNVSLANLSTNMSIRAGTSNQILLDWSSTSVPTGTRDGCGDFGTYPASGGPSGTGACGFTMATLVFNVSNAGDDADFTLSSNSPGNVLSMGDGSTPANPTSGDFVVTTPEPTTALLVGLGLAGLGVAGRRRS
jgi:hypothetical protein